MVSISDLPREILLQILGYLPNKKVNGKPKIDGTLLDVCFVSKSMRDLATPLIYRSFTIEYGSELAPRLAKSLLQPAHQGLSNVYHLSVAHEDWKNMMKGKSRTNKKTFKILRAIVQKIPNDQLQSLSIIGPSDWFIQSSLQGSQRHIRHTEIKDCSEYMNWEGWSRNKVLNKATQFREDGILGKPNAFEIHPELGLNKLKSLSLYIRDQWSLITLISLLVTNTSSLRQLRVEFTGKFEPSLDTWDGSLARAGELDGAFALFEHKWPRLTNPLSLQLSGIQWLQKMVHLCDQSVDIRKINSLRLYNCGSFTFPRHLYPEIQLQELVLDHSGNKKELDLCLRQMHPTLKLLVITQSEEHGYPSMKAILHHQVLKYLWLSVNDSSGSYCPLKDQVWPDPSAESDDEKGASESSSDVFDFDSALNRLSLLELAVPVDYEIRDTQILHDLVATRPLKVLRLLNGDDDLMKELFEDMDSNYMPRGKTPGPKMIVISGHPKSEQGIKSGKFWRCDFYLIETILNSLGHLMLHHIDISSEQAKYLMPDSRFIDWRYNERGWKSL